MCTRFTKEDAIHHEVQIDKSMHITTASCNKGVLNGMLLSTNLFSLNTHTSTDLEDIFTDHVT